MNKTKIEWCDFTWNPVTGCLHGCPYCYGRRFAKRFPRLFPNGYTPTFHPERLSEPYNIPKNFHSKNPNLPEGSAMIFTVSIGDLFGSWVEHSWVHHVFRVIWNCSGNGTFKAPKHYFQILTKAPQNIELFFPINYTFPPNLWIGTTVEDQSKIWRIEWIASIKKHYGIRFVSFEPLLRPIETDLSNIDWIIIGAQTNPYKPPEAEWVRSLIRQARDAGAAIFLKDNLHWHEKIQEWPEVRI